MSGEIVVKYVGFKPMLLMREYTFQVSEAGENREFKLNIANAAFVSRHARYQDAPAICSERLQAELAAHSNHPPETEYEITVAELDKYRESRTRKTVRGFSGWKKAQEDF
jgi:hypothetical protein